MLVSIVVNVVILLFAISVLPILITVVNTNILFIFEFCGYYHIPYVSGNVNAFGNFVLKFDPYTVYKDISLPFCYC